MSEVPQPPPPPPPPAFSNNLTQVSRGYAPAESLPDTTCLINELKRLASKEWEAIMDVQSPQRLIGGILTVSSLLQPVLQQGPMCGLVALEMAAQRLAPSLKPELILEEAKRKCYTKSGEMFSVNDMANLASSMLKCEARTMNTDRENEKNAIHEIVNCILDGNFALVPYDADHNHSPTLRKGHSAHWALLIGITLFLDLTPMDLLKSSTFPVSDERIPVLFKEGSDLDKSERQVVLECLKNISMNQIYINARQGKSAHIGLWKITDLMESNQNLKEIAPKIVAKPAFEIQYFVQTIHGPHQAYLARIQQLEYTKSK